MSFILLLFRIEQEHATIVREANSVFVVPANAAAEIIVNGKNLTTKQQLKHLDRILFGWAAKFNPILIKIMLLCACTL